MSALAKNYNRRKISFKKGKGKIQYYYRNIKNIYES